MVNQMDQRLAQVTDRLAVFRIHHVQGSWKNPTPEVSHTFESFKLQWKSTDFSRILKPINHMGSNVCRLKTLSLKTYG